MISKEEVKHIAKLARLGLTEKEIAKYQRELSSILDYVEKLKEVDVSRVEPTSHSIAMENVMRDDRASEKREENKFSSSATELSRSESEESKLSSSAERSEAGDERSSATPFAIAQESEGGKEDKILFDKC